MKQHKTKETAASGSRPILRRDKAWTFEIEKANGQGVWGNTGLGNGKRAPECLVSKNKPTAYFNRMEGSTLIYRIPSENTEVEHASRPIQ